MRYRDERIAFLRRSAMLGLFHTNTEAETRVSLMHYVSHASFDFAICKLTVFMLAWNLRHISIAHSLYRVSYSTLIMRRLILR